MTDILITATIKPVSNQPKDFVTNSFALQVNPGDPMIPVFEKIRDFYDEPTAANPSPLTAFMATSIDREAADGLRLRAYNITGKLMGAKKGQPATYAGSPFAEYVHNIMYGANSNVSLPSECAAVLTLRGNDWQNQPVEAPDGVDEGAKVDRLRARRSGRLFIGPLNQAAASTDAAGVARIHGNLSAVLLAASLRLQNALTLAAQDWCVWSRADEAMYGITDVQVDNEFDTQRRRGVKSTVRNSQAV